jgi:murein DD-endopeptidase MepM/ murein hydrolase activator NlpD
MSTSSVVHYLWRLFPHRQLLVRSRGSVRFHELTPGTQIAFALGLLAFFCWVAYASVLVMFNENIIAAKDQQYDNMVALYENKVSALQVEKEEVNALLQLAEERFQNATLSLESKMRSLTQLAMQRQAMERDMREVKRRASYMIDFPGRRNFAAKVEEDGANELSMIAQSLDPVARLSKGLEPNTQSTIATVAASVIPRKRYGANLSQNVFVKRIGALEDRLTSIKRSQMALLREMNDNAQGQIDKLESQLSTTGLPVSELVASLGANARMTGRGGPLIPMSRSRNPAAIDPLAEEFDRQMSRVSVAFNRLDSLTTTLSRIPLVTPVQNGQYRLTSGFSYRVDPFTGRGAFHSGLDLAAGYGTTILASAPGRVVVAEHRGPYGNMVEIDHGYGIRTRYAHLQSMYVSVGDRVAFRQKIAAMGSTGRSTGPHLHYEIWFRDVARDPMKFFNAGRYVFEG